MGLWDQSVRSRDVCDDPCRPHQATDGSALEAACSIGVCGALLAPRCDRLLSLDLVERAVGNAAVRLAPHPGARAIRETLPDEWPQRGCDLVLLSALTDYLPAPDIETLARLVARDASARGACVIVHSQGETERNKRPDDARNRFCGVLSSLRPVDRADHPSAPDDHHRTVLFGP